MLTLASIKNRIVLLEHETEEKEWPEMVDYNPWLKRFDTIRHAYVLLPDGWTEARMLSFLRSRPKSRIRTTVSHDPIMTELDRPSDMQLLVEQQRVVIDGEPYIDPFGLYVYIATQASWDGKSDVDLRFNTNQYPYHLLPPELIHFL